MWFEPMNVALRQAGLSPFDPNIDEIVDPDYRDVLMSPNAVEGELRPRRIDSSNAEADRLRYVQFNEEARADSPGVRRAAAVRPVGHAQLDGETGCARRLRGC